MDNVVELSRFVHDLSFDDLPEKTIDHAKLLLLDIYATTIAGSTAEAVPEVVDMVRDWGGKRQSSLMMFGDRLPAPLAGFANSVMAHARDYDDTHDAAVIHTGVVVIPAALAAAQIVEERGGGVTGKDLICAIVAGVEVHCRTALSLTQSVAASGYTYTSLCGYFAAAATAANLLGLDVDQTVNALGIVYTQAAGTNQAAIDAALAKRMQPGFAVKAGILSAVLAEKGVTGVHEAFQGTNGFYHTYMKGNADPDALVRNLGEAFEIDALSYKPFPCCRFTHNSICAAKNLMDRERIDPNEIERIDISCVEQVYKTVCDPLEVRKNPQNVVQAQFSIPYTVASVIATGDVTLANFQQEHLADPRVQSVISKIYPVIDEELDRKYGRGCAPTIVNITTHRGAYTESVQYAKGSPENPMTLDDIEEKVRANTAFAAMLVDKQKLGEAVAAIKKLEASETIESLIATMNAPLAA